jgi:hypothetical protein
VGKKIYPLNYIRYWYAYDIDEVCTLYKGSRLHQQTVRQWINNGLKTLDGGKPTLIYGNDLKEFLGKQNVSGRFTTEFHQFPCFKCQEPKEPFRKEIQLEHTGSFLKAKARCQTCKKLMNKSYKLNEYQHIKKIFNVVALLELYDTENTTTNTHFPVQDNKHLTELLQGDLFL